MKRTFAWGMASVGLVASSLASAAQGGALLSAAPSVYAAAGNDRAYAALAAHPSAHALQVVMANAAAIDARAEQLQLDLDIGGPVRLNALRQSAYTTEDGSLVWQGLIAETAKRYPAGPNEIADDPMNSVILVRNGDKVTGNIRVLGQLYKLRPMRDGRHVLVETDESRMPPDHPQQDYAELFAKAPALPVADEPSKAQSVIRVLVNYTGAVAQSVDDVPGLINLAIAEANQGYANSDVAITLQLAQRARVRYAESDSFGTDLDRYEDRNDRAMDEIHAQRDASAADVAVLLIDNDSSCGKAAAIGASASSAFAVAHWDCATGYYSFAHEIGHLQSARHDPATDDSTRPYSYGHGYRSDAGGWRTIMAYDCDDHCTRLNFWSNPHKTYRGRAMGTERRSDNHRVLNNTRSTVAGFR